MIAKLYSEDIRRLASLFFTIRIVGVYCLVFCNASLICQLTVIARSLLLLLPAKSKQCRSGRSHPG